MSIVMGRRDLVGVAVRLRPSSALCTWGIELNLSCKPLMLWAYVMAAKYVFAVEKTRLSKEIDAMKRTSVCSEAGKGCMFCWVQNSTHILSPVS